VMNTLRNKLAFPGTDVDLCNDCFETLKNDEMKFFGDTERMPKYIFCISDGFMKLCRIYLACLYFYK